MTRAAGETAWCANCHHLARWGRRTGWTHVSDDDWSAFSCPCANRLLPCVPERRRRRPDWTYLGVTEGTMTFGTSGAVTLGPGRLYTRAVDSEDRDRPPKEQP